MRGLRVALYYAPDRDDPLWQAGCRWLGRDAETGAACRQPALPPELVSATAQPRRYGFHATLKAPMRLTTGWDELIADVDAFAARAVPFALPRLVVGQHAGTLALLPGEPCPALDQLAAELVTMLDPHRLQADANDLARHRRRGLDAAEEAYLMRWGYPYVLDRFRFHMTLTGPGYAPALEPAARDWFADALAVPRRMTALCLFTERAVPGEVASLLIAERLPFRGAHPRPGALPLDPTKA